jgi:surfeit locus 1 family protein
MPRPDRLPMTKARKIGLLVFATLLMAILLGLGAWQLQRLQWKENLIAQSKSAVNAKPVSLTDIEAGLENGYDVNLLRVRMTGIYHHDLERYVYRSNGKKPGFHVVTPFIEETGYVVLVDRGWVNEKNRLPKDRQDARKPEGKINITGITRVHATGLKMFLPDADRKKNIWYWYDRNGLAQSYPEGLGQSADGQMAITAALFLQVEPGGEPGNGLWPQIPPVEIKLTNNHLQYAITWFALALALLVMGILFFQSGREKKTTK